MKMKYTIFNFDCELYLFIYRFIYVAEPISESTPQMNFSLMRAR